MKTLLTIPLFLILVTVVNGQTIVPGNKGYQVGVSYFSSITYRSLRYDDEENFIADKRDSLEVPKYGYAFAVLAQKLFKRRSGIELGISFSNSGYKTKEEPLSWSNPKPEFPTGIHTSYSFLHLGISVRYLYRFGTNKIQFYAAPGLVTGALLERKSTITLIYPDGDKSETSSGVSESFQRAAMTIIIGIGAKYNISKRLYCFFEPQYRHELISVIPEKQNKEYLYAYGLNIALLYSLRGKK